MVNRRGSYKNTVCCTAVRQLWATLKAVKFNFLRLISEECSKVGRDNRKELKRDAKHDTDVVVNRLKVPFSFKQKGIIVEAIRNDSGVI